MADDFFSWDSDSGGNDYSSLDLPLSNWTNVDYSTLGQPTLPTSFEIPSAPVYDFSNYGSPVDSGSRAGDLTGYITDPSLWDQISGYVDKGAGVLGSVWDKLTAGSGDGGNGISLLSQLGTLGVGGLSAYANYDAYRDANNLAKLKGDRDYELAKEGLGLSRDSGALAKLTAEQNYGLRQAEVGLNRDASMLSQQSARVGAADNLSKTSAIFDLIKQRQGVDLSGNLKPYTDQLTAQGWTPDYGLAPVTSTLGQFGTAPRPQLPPALANTQLPATKTQAPSPDRAYAFARGGAMPGNGAAQGALGLLAGNTAGQDDSINARLSDGEYVMDADIVAALGDGNTAAGARKLDQMRESIRRHKRSAPHDSIPPKAKSIEAYLKGGRK